MYLDDIQNILFSILKAQLITIGIIVASYLIEKITGLKLLIDHYTWKKSPHNVEVLSTGDSAYYFIVNLIVFIYDIYSDRIEFKLYNIILWLVLAIFLTIGFYRVHKKYQRIDFFKNDNDYS